MEVYKAIASIIGEMSTEGISKGSKNQQQGFMFRGIDAVYNALAPKLAKHNLMILPRVLSRSVTEKQTRNGGTLFYVVCDCEFDFVSAVDGSKHTVKVFGEAMDSGDKATNKAMSIALKYAAFQTFFIPTEANTQDPDASCHDVVNQAPAFNPQECLTKFTQLASGADIKTLQGEFKKAWTSLANTPQQAKAKEVYDLRKSELETPQA